MVDHLAPHSEMITQLLRHMTPSPPDAGVKGDMTLGVLSTRQVSL